jgi:DNA-binding ferritin-like protein
MEDLNRFIGSVKALECWFHAAHHLTKGMEFIADHDVLYDKIYTFFGDYFDAIVEKLMAITGSEKIACPIIISKYSGFVLEQIPSPADKDSRQIAEISYDVIINHLHEIERAYDDFEKFEIMTKGMDDLLASNYSELETFIYFLQRKLK